MGDDGPDTTNHEKYTQGIKNPVVSFLMYRLFARVRNELQKTNPTSLLDAGCGEGHALQRLADLCPHRVEGFDLNPQAIAFCKRKHPGAIFSVHDIYRLGYKDDTFDVVLCMEVLEHLEWPATALRELARVARRHLILTVPNEPWFRLGNLARGQYRDHWGNHPEHVQHWGVWSFASFLEEHLEGCKTRVRSVGPWLIGSAGLCPSRKT